ncbi:replication-relaxation family protein [Lentzea sp. NPDC051838]|uniref:replication-relaxation family protein n=1 Tax=Lentzea sp. NPDC051838 TaxID=3154849 RepID=UPI00342863BA
MVELVAELGQLPARLIGDFCFYGLRSATPLKRSLHRLTQHQLLSRVELRLVGGAGGGSRQFVYQLGKQGGRLLGMTKECPRFTRYDPHMVMTAECVGLVRQLEHTGQLALLGFKGEDTAYTDVRDPSTGQRIKLTPDAWLDVGVHEPRRRLELWLEVDRGTEHNSVQIAAKLARYVQAYRAWDTKRHGAVFPRIVFVAPDSRRVRRLWRELGKVPAEFRILFAVEEFATFPQAALTEVKSID